MLCTPCHVVAHDLVSPVSQLRAENQHVSFVLTKANKSDTPLQVSTHCCDQGPFAIAWLASLMTHGNLHIDPFMRALAVSPIPSMLALGLSLCGGTLSVKCNRTRR